VISGFRSVGIITLRSCLSNVLSLWFAFSLRFTGLLARLVELGQDNDYRASDVH
jgi:hypothetical protein